MASAPGETDQAVLRVRRGRERGRKPPDARQLKPRRREEGQAIVMASVGIFIMVLGILATLNLGQAVHQKIKLQNTADSAAYTLAAMEARTFNYIAFLNRAQIAHYNTAMVVQSYITWVGFQVAAFGTAVDLVTSLYNSNKVGADWPCSPPYIYLGCPYKWIGKPATAILSQVAQQLSKFAVMLYGYGETIGHWITNSMSLFNEDLVWQTQLMRAAVLNGHILTGMMDYIGNNLDKDISFTKGKSKILNSLVNAALNSIEYYQAFSNASGVNPFVYGLFRDIKRVMSTGEYKKVSDDGAKDAYRIMSELCHATRTPRFVSNRGDSFFATMGVANVFGQKYGQTKFTSKNDMKKAKIPPIGDEGNYEVVKYLSSDDYADSATGMATLVAFVSYTGSSNTLGDAVWGYNNDSKHYKYKGGKTSGLISPDGQGMFAFPPVSGTSKTMETKSGSSHAPWNGFAPYFMFNAKGDRTYDYNQPSTWIFLNKNHGDFQTGNKQSLGANDRSPWYAKFTFTQGSQTASLDTTIGGSRNSYLFEGLNVIARGMAYYHRPDNWTEHPNFFNPFWRAKLAPVGQKLQSFWDRWVTSKITTSSDSAVVKALVNVLRNAQMDLFTAVITAAITH
jgi:hypothetical protein